MPDYWHLPEYERCEKRLPSKIDSSCILQSIGVSYLASSTLIPAGISGSALPSSSSSCPSLCKGGLPAGRRPSTNSGGGQSLPLLPRKPMIGSGAAAPRGLFLRILTPGMSSKVLALWLPTTPANLIRSEIAQSMRSSRDCGLNRKNAGAGLGVGGWACICSIHVTTSAISSFCLCKVKNGGLFRSSCSVD